MPSRVTGDLFPRGHERGQPVVRKKRDAKTSSKGTTERERDPQVRRRKLTEGSTVLAVVTRSDANSVSFELSSGARGRADPYEITSDDCAPFFMDTVGATTGEREKFEPEREEKIPLYKVLRVGQVVRAAVITPPANSGSKHLQLSLKPALVNSGLNPGVLRLNGTPVYSVVKSVEDHGYILDFGPLPTTGFLPFEDAPVVNANRKASEEEEEEEEGDDDDVDSSSDDNVEAQYDGYMLPGAPLEVVVTQGAKKLSSDDTRRKKSANTEGTLSTVRCSAKFSLIAKAESIMSEGLTFRGLRAGMRVSAKVLSVSPARVTLTIFGLFTVIVESTHAHVDANGKINVKVGASVMVRLLSVDPNQKVIMASLLPDIVNSYSVRKIPDSYKIGSILSNLVVDRVEPSFGLYLRSDRNFEQDGHVKARLPLFAHISRCAEKRIDTLEKYYHPEKKLKVKARIISIARFDGVVNVDLRPSIISRAALDITEVEPGKCYNCKVISHLSSGNLSVAVDGDTNIRGVISKQHIADTPISGKMLSRHPNLRSGGTVECTVLSVNEERGIVNLSARRSLVHPASPLLLSYERADESFKTYKSSPFEKCIPIFVGTVCKIFDDFLLILFCNGVKGSVEFSELGLEMVTGRQRKRKRTDTKTRTREEIEALYPLGQTVRVCVIGVDVTRERLSLSMDLTGSKIIGNAKRKTKMTIPDDFIQCTVANVYLNRGLTVYLPVTKLPKSRKKKNVGFVSLCDIDDDFDRVKETLVKLKKGNNINCRLVEDVCVEEVESNKKMFTLSLRLSDKDTAARDPIILPSDLPLEAGRQVRGFIHSVTKFGAFVDIGRNVRARIRLSDLSDDYVQDPKKSFPRGKLVDGKICKIENSDDDKDRLVLMSLRTKEKPEKTKPETQVKEGDVVQCTVSRIEKYGAIVKLSCERNALLHSTEVDDERKIKNPFAVFSVGQKLTAVVVSSKAKGVNVGLKRSYFMEAGVSEDEIDSIMARNSEGKPGEQPKKKQKADSALSKIHPELGDDDLVMEDEAVSESTDDDDEKDSQPEVEYSDGEECTNSDNDGDDDDELVLNIAHSLEPEHNELNLNSMLTNESDDDEIEKNEEQPETEEPTVRKKTTAKEKREKKRAKEAAEREIQMKEEALASNEQVPETAEDFERMLIAEPNSSAIWIRYMAFRLSLVQVDKARAVAERALDTIAMEKELERVNIWMAYINLEASFSTSGHNNLPLNAAAVFRVFDRAVKRVTDQLGFHLQVFNSLRETEPQIAGDVMKRAMRHFKSSKEVWIAAGLAKFESGDSAGARKLMERALLSLEKRDHVSIIIKFSQFEYRHGLVEKGRTVFESLIGNYPKRLDVWNVFIDMETGVCRRTEEDSAERKEAIEATRLLFERCASLDLSSKKMKSVFKKWLSFEKAFGDTASYDGVIARAKQYVENKSSVIDATVGDANGEA